MSQFTSFCGHYEKNKGHYLCNRDCVGYVVAEGQVQPGESQFLFSPEVSVGCLFVWYSPLFPEIGDDKPLCNFVNSFLHCNRKALSHLR